MKRHNSIFLFLSCLLGLALTSPWPDHTDKFSRPYGQVPCINVSIPCTRGDCSKLIIQNYGFGWDEKSEARRVGKGHTVDDSISIHRMNNLSKCSWNATQSGRVDFSNVKILDMGYGDRPNPEPSFITMLLQNITALREFHWQSKCLPLASVLDVLEDKHPSVQLHYTYGLQSWDWDWQSGRRPFNHTSQLLEIFGHRKVLHRLNAHILYSYGDESVHVHALERLVSRAPNLKELQFGLDHFGCTELGPHPYAFDFTSLERGQKFPPLEVLELTNCDFNAVADGDPLRELYCHRGGGDSLSDQLRAAWIKVKFWIKSRIYKDFALHMTEDDEFDKGFLEWVICPVKRKDRYPNIEKWMEHMDWSDVRTLSINGKRWTPPAGNVFKLLVTNLPKLENLSLRFMPGTSTSYFLEHLPQTLKSLSIVDTTKQTKGPNSDHWPWRVSTAELDNLLSAITRHSSTLRSLSLWADRVLRDGYADRTNWTLSGFSLLETLNIDMPRSANHSEALSPESIRFLASAPALKDLTLRFPSLHKDWVHSYEWHDRNTSLDTNDDQFSNQNVLQLFKSIRGAQHSISQRLPKLRIYMGDLDWLEKEKDKMIGPQEPQLQIGRWDCTALPGFAFKLTRSNSRSESFIMLDNTINCVGDLWWPKIPW